MLLDATPAVKSVSSTCRIAQVAEISSKNPQLSIYHLIGEDDVMNMLIQCDFTAEGMNSFIFIHAYEALRNSPIGKLFNNS